VLIDVAEWRQDILEEHLEELESLWNRRLAMPRVATSDAVGLRRCDARIEAHSDALVLAGEAAWPLVSRALLSGEAPLVAAAAMVIASSEDPERDRQLIEVFPSANEGTQSGLRAALQLRCPSRLRAALTKLATSDAAVAASGWSIVAVHGEKVAADRRAAWMNDNSPEVRRLVWQIEARSRDRRDSLARVDYLRAFDDPDRAVRAAALEAAARTAQPWFLDYLRSKAVGTSAQDMNGALFLAALGGPDDLPALLAIGDNQDLGWFRFTVLALCGRSQAVEALLRVMQEGPPVDVALAGIAFFRITGIDVQLPERIPLVPEGIPPDELSDEIKTCDPERAARGWESIKSSMGTLRWVRGNDVTSLAYDQLPHSLDLETRWSLQLRAAFEQPMANTSFDTERFPFT
jgi:uncharacterized protein (TIGR02270 family)